MVDRGGRRGRRFEPLRNKWLHRHANSQDKNSPSQSRGMIVRRAAVLMLRPRVAVVAVVAVVSVVAVAVVVMDMRHAVAVCRDLPMFVGMRPLRGGQYKEAGQPEKTKTSANEHKLQATFGSFGVKQVHVRRATLTHSGVLRPIPKRFWIERSVLIGRDRCLFHAGVRSAEPADPTDDDEKSKKISCPVKRPVPKKRATRRPPVMRNLCAEFRSCGRTARCDPDRS